MRPLLWKEMRDLRPWIFMAGAGVMAVQLLCLSPTFEQAFMSLHLVGLMPLLATLSAVGLGVGQVARERHTKTLDFLLVRPVAAGTIVWAKFLAGTLGLLLLLAALVALGYRNPGYTEDIGIAAVRGALGGRVLFLALFPRYWCLYAMALLFSVLVDRAVKAAAAVAVCALTLLGLAFAYTDLAPFAGIEAWLPFLDSTGALLRVGRDPALLWSTGLPLSAAALITALCAAALLQRSPERYWGNSTLVLGAAGLVGLAILAVRLSGEQLPAARPAGSLALDTKNNPTDFAAERGLVCVGLDDGLIFLDFSEAAKPRKMAEVHIPLWTTSHVVLSVSGAYVVGKRKAIPTDEVQVVPVRLTASDTVQVGAPITLGPAGSGDFMGTAVQAGHFLYISSSVRSECRLRVFDLSTGREAEPLTLDVMRPTPGQTGQEEPTCRSTLRLGEPYLYVASPSYLTTFDTGDGARPLVASRIDYHDALPILHGFTRNLVAQGNALYESAPWPQSLRSYSLRDPRQPLPPDDLTWHATGSTALAGSGTALYQPWRRGVLEFHREGRGLRALRYLNDGPKYGVSSLAVTAGYLYTLGYDQILKQQRVAAFRIGE